MPPKIFNAETRTPQEFRFGPVRECPFFHTGQVADEEAGQVMQAYWKEHVEKHAGYDPRLEHAVLVFLDHERKLLGHSLAASGGESFVISDALPFLGMGAGLKAGFVIFAHN